MNRDTASLEFAFMHGIVEFDLCHQPIVNNQIFQRCATLDLNEQQSAEVKPIQVTELDRQFAEGAI
jgi:hypothetical protein